MVTSVEGNAKCECKIISNPPSESFVGRGKDSTFGDLRRLRQGFRIMNIETLKTVEIELLCGTLRLSDFAVMAFQYNP
jgi:hypothetical protein